MRAVGAKGNVGVAGVVGNAAEVYAAGAVEVGVFDLVEGVAALSAEAPSPVSVAAESEPSPESWLF